MQKHKIYNLIVLDESGSMESIKQATLSGFNEIVQTVKAVEAQNTDQQHFVSLTTFNGVGIKQPIQAKPVAELQQLDENSYQPNASTPLYDAIGFSCQTLLSQIDKQSPYHVLVTILTDGEENSSEEFSASAVKTLIEKLKKENWTFTYIGANHDVEKNASSLSITNSITFVAEQQQVAQMFEKDKQSRIKYASKIAKNENVDEDYFA